MTGDRKPHIPRGGDPQGGLFEDIPRGGDPQGGDYSRTFLTFLSEL